MCKSGISPFKRHSLRKETGKMRRLFMLSLTLCVGLVFSVAQAQVTTGTVRGVVTDQNGAIVPGAKVTITKKSTGSSSTTQSSDSGSFEFTNLPVGEDYTVKVEATNFKGAELTDVHVNLNTATDLPVQL